MTAFELQVPQRIRQVLDRARSLPDLVPDILGIALVGSWSRGTARLDSDVDLVVLLSDPAMMLDRSDWFAVFDPAATLIRSSTFGAITERRLELPDSTVVEVGIGQPQWANVHPIEEGTRRVVEDGFAIVYDPSGSLAALAEVVRPTVDRRQKIAHRSRPRPRR